VSRALAAIGPAGWAPNPGDANRGAGVRLSGKARIAATMRMIGIEMLVARSAPGCRP
jgi:hypothetical protein